MQITIIGAPGTGKTHLVDTLRQALQHGSAAAADCTIAEVNGLGSLHQLGTADLVLLMGRDLPHSGGAAGLQADAGLRRALDSQSIPFAVVYGQGQARTDCALQAIAYHRRQTGIKPRPVASDWQWCCDTCSDAACEHRLFTALVNRPAQEPSVRP